MPLILPLTSARAYVSRVKVTVLTTLAPLATVPNEQVKSGPEPTFEQPAGSVPRVKPVGHVSVIDTFCASDGPPL